LRPGPRPPHAGELEALLAGIQSVDVVSPPTQHLDEEVADEAAADDEDAPARDPFDRAENAREWLGERRSLVREGRRNVDPVAREDTLGEPAGLDRRGSELLARRLVARQAPLALPAGEVVDERDSPSVRELRGDLMAENRPGSGTPDLLDVAPAEPTRQDAGEPALPLGLGNLREAGLAFRIQGDCAHAAIVGSLRKEPAWRSSSIAARTSG
jgi:hypothetical protein